MLLACARRGMVGHQEFDQCLPRGNDLIAAGFDHHVVFGFADAGGRVDACSHIDDARAASKIVVPAGTVTFCSSMVRVISFTGAGLMPELRSCTPRQDSAFP